MKIRILLFCLLVATALGGPGCRSINSTMISRNEANTEWDKDRHLSGVPITLKVPTHLKVTVVETHFLQLSGQPGPSGSAQVERVALNVPVRNVNADYIYTEKIFTVDFKRPAAGTMNMTLDMNDQQYFDKIQHQIVDQTIQDVSKLVSTLAPQGVFTPAAEGGQKINEAIKEIESVVAVQIFEIDDPDFEERLSAFLNCHINQAHDAWVMPPGVERVRRIGLQGTRDIQPLFCPGCDISYGHAPFSPESF